MPPKTSKLPLGENPTKGNVLPQNTTTSSEPNKKRKAEPEYDIDDPICQMVDISCNAVRAKIRRFIESGEMKVGEFQKTIGTNSKTYHAFMKQNGPYKGSGSTVYGAAFAFFKLRELNGVKIKKRKVDAAGSKEGAAKVDTDFGDIVLEGEEKNEVPVYDSCDEIRKKIRAYMSRTLISQAQFSRELGKLAQPNKASVSGLAPFLGKKGPAAGNTTQVFYCSYLFFEKMRIRDGKPKTEHRLGMEDAWDGCDPFGMKKPGMEVKRVIDREQYLVPVGSSRQIYQDEFGKATMGW